MRSKIEVRYTLRVENKNTHTHNEVEGVTEVGIEKEH